MPGSDFKRIVESLKVPVALTDAAGNVTFANVALGELCGCAERDLAGRPLAGLFRGEDQARVRQSAGRVGEGRAASAMLDVRLAADEDERWVQLVLQPRELRDKAEGVIAVLHDITAERETERSLYVLTARLLALAEATPVAALIESAEGTVEMVSEAFIRLLGLEGAPQSYMGLAAGDVLGRAGSAARETLERQPILVEGEAAGAIWSPRRSAPLEEASRGAAEIALIEKVGEELSVALEGISAISIRAQQMEFDPVLVEHFQRIRRSTESALAAIGDLVDFSNVSGSIVLRNAPFRLRASIAGLVGRLVEQAEENDCSLRVKVEQDVADALEGDVERLELVVKNLLASAFSMLPGAEITLQITPEYLTESGIRLSFAAVYSAEAATKTAPLAVPDTGMGIAVARFMVAAMGGELSVAAKPSPGEALYAFTIEFPVGAAPALPPRPTYLSFVGLTALVVSGDPQQRLWLSNLLRGWRMVPLEADNAAMAMALLERLHGEGNPVPLVILNNRLAGQDGFLLAFRIKHHPALAATLVMMLATEGRPGDAIACRENGISAYMRYPINDRQLNEAIAAVTGASAQAVEAEATAPLVTRHSLRESRKGATVLLVDPDPASHILAAHILGRQDCSVVVAHDLEEALAALDQDVYDVVLFDTSLEGARGADAQSVLRSHLARDVEATRIVGIAKPLRREDLLALVGDVRRGVEAQVP